MSVESIWPDDEDGDVFRRLADAGFDFTAEWDIDFNIDFESWPPPDSLLKELHQRYVKVEVIQPDGEYSGYVTFVVKAKLSYNLVLSTQATATKIARPFGGSCESWGVLY